MTSRASSPLSSVPSGFDGNAPESGHSIRRFESKSLNLGQHETLLSTSSSKRVYESSSFVLKHNSIVNSQEVIVACVKYS